jgi:hypothetical protein
MHYAGDEELESFMNRFFAGVSPPKVAKLSLAFPGLAVEHVYPDPIPDLFGRDSLVVLGRYTDKRSVTSRVRLRGVIDGKSQTVTKVCEFPVTDPAYPYIPSLWAMRRLAVLMEGARGATQNLEAARQVNEFALRYGFRVPLSFEAQRPNGGKSAAPSRDMGTLLWTLTKSLVPGDVESDQFKQVNGRVFRREGARWIETPYHPGIKTVKVGFFGEDYFSLLRKAPDLGPYLAVGPEVTLLRGETAVEVILKP